MSGSHGRLAAACVLLALASGCTLDSFSLNVFGAAKGDGLAVTGSLDVVADSAQKALHDMGLFVTVGREADTVKLVSRTRDGKGFTLVLKARQTDHGDETQVSIRWDKDRDDAFWADLALNLARPRTGAATP